MKKNLIQKIKCLLCGVLVLVPLFPYRVFADTYLTSANILGCNIENHYFHVNSDTDNWYQFSCTLDGNYKGSAYMSINYYIGNTQYSKDTWVIVNGSKFDVLLQTIAGASNTIEPTKKITASIISNNNIKYIDNGDGSKYSSFPIESFNVQSYAFSNLNYEGFVDDSIYTYGIFSVPQNTEIYRSYGVADREYWYIFVMDKNMYNQSVVSNFLTFNNCTLDTYNFYTRFYYQGNLTYIYRFGIKVDTTNQFYITYKGTGNAIYMPIYCNEKSYLYNSTDFALTYGLSNSLLDDLHIIAQGTQQSSSSSSDLEDSADDIVQNSSTMFTFENQQNQNMNNALQNINTNYDIGSFGSSFLSSANWVRNQFDNITSSTPFGSVLSFSLLLGLALLIIGKVYK